MLLGQLEDHRQHVRGSRTTLEQQRHNYGVGAADLDAVDKAVAIRLDDV